MNQEALQVIIDKTHALMKRAFLLQGGKGRSPSLAGTRLARKNEAEAAKKICRRAGSGYHAGRSVDRFLPVRIRALKCLGAEQAKQVAAHAAEIKAAGAKYCDCPACAAAEAILEKKALLLK